MKKKLIQIAAGMTLAFLSGNLFAQEASESILVNSLDVTAANLPQPQDKSPVLEGLFLNQWVQVAKDGFLSGSVVALVGNDTVSLPKMRVSLFHDGKAFATDDTDIEGNFLLEKVVPGRYTLVAENTNLLSIFALTVLDEVAGRHLPNSIEVRVLSTETGRVYEILRSQTLPHGRLDPFKNVDPFSVDRTIVSTHQVMLSNDGTLSGQLGRQGSQIDMSSMMVYLTKDGREIKRTRVSRDGKFSVAGLSPGCFGLVAVGEQGVAATGFCAVAHQVAQVKSRSGAFVAFYAKPASSLKIELGEPVQPTNPEIVQDSVSVPESIPAMGQMVGGAPMAGFGGGFGGGGGIGASAGGGLGSLAAIGGLTAAGIIAANKKNTAANTNSPIVP